VDFIFAQNHPSVFEKKGDPYNLIRLGWGFDIQLKHQIINFNVTVNNLPNVAYFDYLLTLKDVGIYNTGRNISVNLKIPFGLKR